MHEALSSSLGAHRGRSELEGRWSVKKENTVDMHFPSPNCRRAGSHRAWKYRSEEGILSGRRGIYVPSQCASQVTWQLDVGYLRRGSLCSGKISLVLAFLGFSFVIHPT